MRTSTTTSPTSTAIFFAGRVTTSPALSSSGCGRDEARDWCRRGGDVTLSPVQLRSRSPCSPHPPRAAFYLFIRYGATFVDYHASQHSEDLVTAPKRRIYV